MQSRALQIADWLRARVTAAGARGLVVGLTGTLDSAVVARLCQMATPGQVIGAVLPHHSDTPQDDDAGLIAAHLELPTMRVDLEPAWQRLAGDLREGLATIPDALRRPRWSSDTTAQADAPLANAPARLRMTALYYIANGLEYLVAGTTNRSELTMGRFVKFGEGGVDLLPLGNLLTSEVRLLAADLRLPRALLDKAPAPRTAQGEGSDLGFAYSDLERYLVGGPEAVAPALALRLERMIRASEHKRLVPPTPE